MTNTIQPRSHECPVYQLFETFGKKRTLHILQTLAEGVSTFSGIMRRLPQINSKVLTERLDLLLEKGLIQREVSQSKPLKINYHLSNHGVELFSQLEKLQSRVLNNPQN